MKSDLCLKNLNPATYSTTVPLVDVPCPEPGLPLPPAQGVLRLTVVAPLRVSTNLYKAEYKKKRKTGEIGFVCLAQNKCNKKEPVLLEAITKILDL